MTRDEAYEIIEGAIAKISTLRKLHAHSPLHTEFVQTTGLELERIFGAESAITTNFSHVDYYAVGGPFTVPRMGLDALLQRKRHEAYLRGIDVAEGVLISAREQLRRHGIDRILKRSQAKAAGASVFISHGTATPALTKIEKFLKSLGLHPIIVGSGASEGLAVDDLIKKRMDESHCAIILATADEKVEGRRQPRPNVLHEIGLAQEKFDSKVIYLKEVGCEFPSNVRPKVWENFTKNDLAPAFEKIVKELHAFGFI